ncbi:MAG: cell division ATPase MinD [Candidatus Hadarchaeales archaeon]
MGLVIALASGKGGSGKSVVAANLGIAFSKFGKKTLLVDADLPMPNLDICVGLNEPPITLYDVLAGLKPIEKATYRIYGGTEIIPCGRSLEAFFKADVRRLKSVINRVKPNYDYVVMDTSSGLNKYNLSAIKTADEVLWVVNPDEPSLTDTMRLKTAIDLFGIKTLGAVVNRVPSFGPLEKRGLPKLSREEVERKLGCKILGIIPETKQVTKATIMCKPLLEYRKTGNIVRAFRDLARNILLPKTVQSVKK